jgi:hypothetical protein
MCDRPTPASAIRPRWTILYGAALVGLLALALAEIAAPPGGLRTGLRCAVVLAAFVTIAAWVRSNRTALDLQEWCECARRTITVRVIESPRRSARVAPDPLPSGPAWREDEHELTHR